MVRFSLVFSAFLIFVTSGCQKESDAQTQNNGSLASLSTPRAKVTGVFFIRQNSLSSSFTDPKCMQNPAGDAQFFVEKCGYIQTCTGTVAQLDGTSAPFIVSAAHCDPVDLLQSNSVVSPTTDTSAGTGADGAIMELSGSESIQKNGKIFFHFPSSKNWVEIIQWVNHPSYKNIEEFNLATTSKNHDLAIGKIRLEDLSKIKDVASIETKIPEIKPPQEIASKFESDVKGGPANDALTSFKTTFDRALIDSFPPADLYGFGALNNVIVDNKSITGESQKECDANGRIWSGIACYTDGQDLRTTNNTRANTDLRYVNMRVVFSDFSRGFAIFLAPSSYPKGGTCQGDSGGPSFLGTADTRLFAVESYGPFPCAGSPTVRTIVATHLPWIESVIR
ncbi:MAG: trypsin-like serine protease [Silvanigrellales bacterium]|nr:trypsin-like serine protease [Silvanigrellales bacterium]